jgi:hypothetical protein
MESVAIGFRGSTGDLQRTGASRAAPISTHLDMGDKPQDHTLLRLQIGEMPQPGGSQIQSDLPPQTAQLSWAESYRQLTRLAGTARAIFTLNEVT